MTSPTRGAAAAEFARFVAKYRAALYGYVRRRVGHDQDAEDITQEALLRAWRRRNEYVEESQLKSFTYYAADCLIRDLGRRRKSRRTSPQAAFADDALGVAPSSADLHVAAFESDQLVAALAALPDAQRALLVDSHILGLTTEELERRHHATGTVLRSRRYRAHEALRRQFEKMSAPALLVAPWRKVSDFTRGVAQRLQDGAAWLSSNAQGLTVVVTTTVGLGPFGAMPAPAIEPRLPWPASAYRDVVLIRDAGPNGDRKAEAGTSATSSSRPVPTSAGAPSPQPSPPALPGRPKARVCVGDDCVSSPGDPKDPGDEVYIDAPQPVGHVGVKQNEVPVCDKGVPTIGPAGCRHDG